MNLGEFKRKTERHGFFRTLADTALRGVNRFVYLKVLKGVTIQAVDPKFLECEGRYRGLFIPESKLRELCADPINGIDEAFLGLVLPKGDECYGFFQGDTLASYGWYSHKPTEVDEPGLALHFDPTYMYMYKGYTHPDHRGQRLHAVGMTRALEAYLSRRFLGLVSYVEWNNSDSLKSCYRMGYKDFGNVYVARVFGRYFSWSDAGCKRYGFILKHVIC